MQKPIPAHLTGGKGYVVKVISWGKHTDIMEEEYKKSIK